MSFTLLKFAIVKLSTSTRYFSAKGLGFSSRFASCLAKGRIRNYQQTCNAPKFKRPASEPLANSLRQQIGPCLMQHHHVGVASSISDKRQLPCHVLDKKIFVAFRCQ